MSQRTAYILSVYFALNIGKEQLSICFSVDNLPLGNVLKLQMRLANHLLSSHLISILHTDILTYTARLNSTRQHLCTLPMPDALSILNIDFDFFPNEDLVLYISFYCQYQSICAKRRLYIMHYACLIWTTLKLVPPGTNFLDPL